MPPLPTAAANIKISFSEFFRSPLPICCMQMQMARSELNEWPVLEKSHLHGKFASLQILLVRHLLVQYWHRSTQSGLLFHPILLSLFRF